MCVCVWHLRVQYEHCLFETAACVFTRFFSTDVWCVVSLIRHAACGVVEVFLQYITFVSQVFDRTR